MVLRSPGDGHSSNWVVVPTYNEVENIALLIPAILKQGQDFGVLVVDDGSPDGTADLAEKTGRAWPGRVEVVRRQAKEGYGRAIMAGWREALRLGAQAVFTMDCDFSHDPAALPRLALQLEHTDVAVGSRYVLGGRTVNWPTRRKVLSAVANRLARSVAGLPVHDCTGGFRGYRIEVIEQLVKERVQSANYTFLVETLFLAQRMDFSIGEIAIIFKERERGQSKVNGKLIAGAVLNLAKIGLRRLSFGRPAAAAAPEPAQTRAR
ncbi:MAG: polyprenol monophosphomannose synthase [Candidatus Andersenbacteria bacterium]